MSDDLIIDYNSKQRSSKFFFTRSLDKTEILVLVYLFILYDFDEEVYSRDCFLNTIYSDSNVISFFEFVEEFERSSLFDQIFISDLKTIYKDLKKKYNKIRGDNNEQTK